MRWYSLVAIYFLLWTISAFVVLPFGMRTADESGHERIAGTADSAPHHFPALKIAIRVTIVATSLFLLFVANWHFGWVTAPMLDVFGGTAPVPDQ